MDRKCLAFKISCSMTCIYIWKMMHHLISDEEDMVPNKEDLKHACMHALFHEFTQSVTVTEVTNKLINQWPVYWVLTLDM